jgi:Mg-chelatase subunit ChlD
MEKSVMSFENSWLLLVALLPLLWVAYEWTRTRRRLGLILKALSFAAIAIALARPSITLPESKLAVAVLVDTSASTSQADLDRASELARNLTGARGRNWVGVIPFARSTRELNSSEKKGTLRLVSTTGEAGRATDLEAAVREAIASMPGGKIPRIALITDGKETEGSLARAAWQARELNIPIDTFALKGRSKPAVRLESVTIPPTAFTGEQFPIDLVISAPASTPSQIELDAEGHMLGKTQVTLNAGDNPVRLYTSLNTPGALELSISVQPVNSPEIRFDRTVTMRKPKALFFSGDVQQDDIHILSVLTGAQFDVKTTGAFVDPKLTDYQLVVFNNWDLESLPAKAKSDIEEYVRQGGGLLIIGGERNVYVEKNGKPEDPLERTMPAKLAPPRSPEGTGLILIVDKSSSMEGRKMELARLAAIGAVNNLRPIDDVGVLMFDNTFEWAVPVRKAADKAFINSRISGIRPDGGTQIAPALTEAFSRMKTVQVASRHIVLLTDGISEEGNSFTIANAAKAENISISTIGIGQDVNKGYLEKVATAAGGESHFVLDLSQLEQILVKDVQEHTGQTTVERPLSPEVSKRVEILNDVGMETAPQLKGYVRFIAKPTADTILSIDRMDPLFTRWQYGLGRAAVFASDAKSRWSADWIPWKGFDKFWTNIARDLLPHIQDGEATLSYDSANGELVASYRLGRGVPEPAAVPPIYVFGPGDFHQPIAVKKIAAGTYQGRLKIGSRQGFFRLLPAQESRAFPETGLYRPEAELNEYGSNEGLLKQVAEFTGGRFQPEPSAVFTGTGRTIATTLTLWPAFLALAIILSLTELIMRKWKGVIASRFTS